MTATTKAYAISNQIQDMFLAGGFAEVGDIHTFIAMAMKARRICLTACRGDKSHLSVRQIDAILDRAIAMV